MIDYLDDKQVKEDFRRAIQPAWRLPQKLTVSEWADKHRILSESSAEPGKWRTSRTPYLKGPMDAFNDPFVREIVLMMSSQVGKTESKLNMLGYVAAEDPGPSLWVGAKEADVKAFCVERIQPMFNLSEELVKRLSLNKDDINRQGIVLQHMRLHMAWAGSPSGLASRAIKNLFMDEIDKYPPYSGKEADPVDLAIERVKTFWNHKIVKSSTPTTRKGYIFQEYQKTDKRRFYVPCPHCGYYQVFVFDQIKWPENERDPIAIKDHRLAWYECISCSGKITDHMKYEMMWSGVWLAEGQKITKNGKIKGKVRRSARVGFWINAIYSPWLTFSDVAAKFLIVKDIPSKLMNFVNSWLADVWEEKAKVTDKEFLKTRIVTYAEGVVPDPVKVLTCGVDVQEDYMLFALRGWGVGLASWLIRKGKIESWPELIAEIFETKYQKEDGSLMPVRMAAIDTGYRTSEVYEFCRRFAPRACPVKGKDDLNGEIFRTRKIDKFPNGKPIPEGLVLNVIDVNYLKDKLHRLIHASVDDASQWWIYKGITDDYLTQMTSEDKVIKRNKRTGASSQVWQKKSDSAANHYWDCEVYNVACAEMLHISLLKESSSDKRIYKGNRSTRGGERKKFWIGNHKNWLN